MNIITNATEVEKLASAGLDAFERMTVNVNDIGTNIAAAETVSEELRTEAGEVDVLLSDIEAMINLLKDGSWSGNYEEKFTQTLTGLRSEMEQIPTYVRSMAQWAQEVSEAHKANDAAHANNY